VTTATTDILRQALAVTVQAGMLLLENGLATSQVERAITETLTQTIGPYSHCFVTPTVIHVAIEHPDLIIPMTTMRSIRSRSINYQHIVQVTTVLDRLQTGVIGFAEAQIALRCIVQARLRYPFGLLLLANGGVSASATLLFGGQPVDALIAFTSTLIVALALTMVERLKIPITLGYAAGAGIATGAATLAVWSGLPIQGAIVIAGGILILAPGAALLASVQDGISGDLMSSGARGLEAFLRGAAIASGIGVALSLATLFGARPLTLGIQGQSDPVVIQLLAAAISTGCYALTVQAPLRSVGLAAITGMLCWGLGLTITQAPQIAHFGAFAAATLAGIMGTLVARWQRLPRAIYILPAIVPFLPGLTICNGMVALAQHQAIQGQLLLVQAIFTSGALAAGVALSEIVPRRPRWRGRLQSPT
jgi:uncharacterized membrane protein YjjP (DUF1212 family)